jgi:hypothetical protein
MCHYEEIGWRVGNGKFGYGQGDEGTVVNFGLDQDFKIISALFRTQFEVLNPLALTNIKTRLLYSDGIAIYLNGVEMFRDNLDPGASEFEYATVPKEELEMAWVTMPFDGNLLQRGINTFAVEVHRYNSYGPTMSFDLELIAEPGVAPLQFALNPTYEEGAWLIKMFGPSAATVEVQDSTNLLDWTRLGQLTLTNGYGVYRDEEVAGEKRRFYRLELR